MTKIVRLTENDLTRLVRKVINEGNKSDFKKYEKIINNYSNELDDDDRDDENLSEIFKELEELQEKIYKNSELSKKEIKKLDDEIENLMDYITDVLDSY
jgi:gas vesicle protein